MKSMQQMPGMRDFQYEQLAQFLKRGLPTRKEERWKYTDVAYLATLLDQPSSQSPAPEQALKIPGLGADAIIYIFINGQFAAEFSNNHKLPEAVLLCPLSRAFQTHEAILKRHLQQEFDAELYPFATLNAARMTDGIFLFVPPDCVITTPIHLLFLNTQENNFMVCPRNVILASENSQVTLIEEYVGDAQNYFTNAVTHLELGKNSQLNYYKIQNESQSATHLANIFIQQKQNSALKTFSLNRGSRLSRDDMMVAQTEKGAECELYGLYHLTTDLQHSDTHVQVDHLASHGKSSMVYQGILEEKSRAVFNGKVFVHKNAQQVEAHQANHNLLLSPTAEVNTKPELEIYADDVKCNHGATVSQLDDEMLFYLRTRGIEKDVALELLTQAFADEVVNSIKQTAIREYILQQVHHV